MMWEFSITKGTMAHNGVVMFTGLYSGHGAGLNNPAMANVQGVGPIPPGRYKFGTFQDHPHLGVIVSYLFPQPGTNMFGRSGIFLHGDNAEMDHSASDGCIIAARNVREAIEDSGDRDLLVTA